MNATTLPELQAAWACQLTVIQFACMFDDGRHEEVCSLFAPDGIWHRPEGDIKGVDGLRQFLAARNPNIFTRHLLTNMFTTIESDRHARVESYVTAWRWDFPNAPTIPAPLDKPLLIGRYSDRLELHGGQWKIRKRELSVDFRRT